MIRAKYFAWCPTCWGQRWLQDGLQTLNRVPCPTCVLAINDKGGA